MLNQEHEEQKENVQFGSTKCLWAVGQPFKSPVHVPGVMNLTYSLGSVFECFLFLFLKTFKFME